VRKTISHLADRLGDAMATLFTLLALLLIPHAVIRAIIGQALHQWTPITWLAIHTALTIAALATSLASYAIAGCGGMAKASTPAHAVNPSTRNAPTEAPPTSSTNASSHCRTREKWTVSSTHGRSKAACPATGIT